ASQLRIAPVVDPTDNPAGCRVALRNSDLGATPVRPFAATPYRVQRTPKLVRRSDPERLSVGMVLHGRGIAGQSGRQASLPPATFTLYDNSHPYTIDLEPADGASSVQGLIVNFPRTLLPLPPGTVKQVTAVTMPAGPGIGELTSWLLVQLATGMDHYTPAEAARLSTAALDVLATRLARELGGDRWVSPESRRRELQLRIHAFIQEHLGDPELSPAAIAAANHISLRLLHKLFQEQGQTVAGWIRARRLERCRRDLLDPAQAACPVAAVAARWGFRSAIHFSRLFRATYGLPPHEYRLCHSGSGTQNAQTC